MENLARTDLLTRITGKPVIMSRAKISAAAQGFASYGPGRG